MSTFLDDLQSLIRDRISTATIFGTLPRPSILTEQLGSTESDIERELKSNGATVVVMTPELRAASEDDPDRMAVTVSVGAGETPQINRGPTGTGVQALQMVDTILAMLHRWTPPDSTWGPLHIQRVVRDTTREDVVAYTLIFDTRIRIQAVMED